MTPPDAEEVETVARYLADGDALGRADLDRIRRLLAEGSLWEQPRPELVDTIVSRIEAESTSRARTRRRWAWPVGGGIAAAAALAIGVVAASPWQTTAGDGLRVALAGTELAPHASATAVVHDTPAGVAIILDTEGLPPAPEGSYYQAWVKGPAGLVAIGSFHMRGPGAVPIELWSGVDLDAYPEITVTLEPEDGDPASSGELVLAGSA